MTKEFNLENFGICEGISETIVTTGKDKPNAAPIGIIWKDNRLFVRVYKGSDTYSNIDTDKALIANITYDPLLFVRSTFGKLNNDEFTMESVKGTEYPVLKKALGWVFFRCDEIQYGSEALVAWIKPVAGKINNSPLKAPNRGFAAIIEAAVHATRYQLAGEEKYRDLVLENLELAEKCGGKAEKEAGSLIREIVNSEANE
ncbi:hypothetical protein J2755_000247 [Methanohalophilus levihalophilus]|uniref:DUF447 domain-containing protein n=1 Tax=Methanohalophilus levihalophilus TaxID=1431282 RepID=UPI001AE803EF|nr:DUF447 domain-containing protein [Methanohalophilus levihalophilus]MBP2029327.1 hypothetical protein [Methanohalophilus levihalophilus]